MRAVRVPFSPARPSRLKKLPGILPAAYMRSSTSTVRGRKSTSLRFPAVAVERTIVSPARTTTAPLACLASLPVSNEISFPPISTEIRLTSLFIRFLSAASGWRCLRFRPSERVRRRLAAAVCGVRRADGAYERGHDSRVELRAGAVVQLGERPLPAHRRPVWPVRGHRVEGVAHGDDPRS